MLGAIYALLYDRREMDGISRVQCKPRLFQRVSLPQGEENVRD